jgi:hypothetical protein
VRPWATLWLLLLLQWQVWHGCVWGRDIYVGWLLLLLLLLLLQLLPMPSTRPTCL